jgi:5-methylcytosine-specific restriction endonuclease McrA
MLDRGEIYKTEYEKQIQSISARNQSVIDDLRSGMERKEVREKYSLTRSNLKYIIDQYGDESMKIDQTLTAEQIAQKLIDNGTALQYAGEYKRGQYVLLYCDVCGSTMHYAASALFKHVNCKQCKEIAKQAKKQELAAQREADRKAKAEAAEERKRIHEQERTARMHDVYCAVCGEMFQTTNPLRVTCSAECGRKRANTRHTRNKDTRISKDKRIDRIDLHDLFKRDDGVCHICGKQCNWNDYTVTDTTIIAGNWYPSVDHIVPVSLGGADAWDNVMLAHRICNSIRGNRK